MISSGIELEPGATQVMNQPPNTEEGVILGTVAYMSPEQAQGKRIDGRSDVFSFGTVLYEMITGQRAFRGETGISTLAAIINQEPKPAGEIVEELPREVERFIGLCIRKDPARRFQHMEDLKVALEELKEESDSGRLSSGSSSGISGARLSGTRKLAFGGGIAIVALLTLLGAMSWFYLRPASKLFSRAQPADALSQRLNLLISSENHASEPALSPDRNMIAYVAEDQAHMDLFVGRVAGGGRVRLTDDEAREIGPQFSPDGEHILFTRLGAENKLPEIWVVPTLGGHAARVVSNASDAAWSPDGSRIAFVIRQPSQGDALATAAADGTGASTVLRSDALYPFFRNPVWSPDGSQLRVVRSAGGIAGDLWLVPLKDGSPRRLSKDLPGVFSNRPVFTPDGASIIYHTWSSEPDRIWRVPRAGGPAVPVTPMSKEDDTYGDISPDGQWLAFARTEGESTRIYVAPVIGGVPRRLIDSASTLPRWSPDGRWIAFSPNRGYNSGVFVIGVDGAGVRRLSETGGWPVWWPDGKRLGFDVSSDSTLLATSDCVEVSSEIWLLGPQQ
jgi:eukaryotic-like serine/threonine-protein kinase